MFFASFVRRLVRGSETGRSPRRAPGGFVPELTLLEGRALPSGNPALANVLPVGAAALVAESTTTSVPFKLTGGGPAPGGLPLTPGASGPHSATGNATYMGRYTSEGGTFTLDSISDISKPGPVSGTFHGTFVFIAANGDRLVTTYGDGTFTGELTSAGVTDVEFVATFTVDPASSTGRFAGATGSWEMTASAAIIPPATLEFTAPFNYTWTGDGTLHFPKGKK